MRLTFRQSGGYAGLSLGCELDSDELSAEEREALASLLSQEEEQPEPASPPSRARDTLTYEIYVEDDGRSRTFLLDQLNMPAGVEPLVERCMREAGPRPLSE